MKNLLFRILRRLDNIELFHGRFIIEPSPRIMGGAEAGITAATRPGLPGSQAFGISGS